MKRLFFTFITCLMLYTGNCMGQADMVSAMALYDGGNTLFGLGYEHTFASKIGIEANLGYAWKYDFFRPIFNEGYEYNHWYGRIGGKYYFLFAQKHTGEGFYCSAMLDYSRGKAVHESSSISKVRRILAGVGLGGNYFLGDNIFVGGETGIRTGQTKHDYRDPFGVDYASTGGNVILFLFMIKVGWKIN